MAKAGQAQEPSMEEILASIRRIISDDDAPAADAEAAPEADDAAADAAADESDMDPAADMSQDDLDKLFDSAGDDDEPEPEVETVAAVVEEDEPEAAAPAEAEPDVLELTEDFATDADDVPAMVEGLPQDTDSGELAFVADEAEADDAFAKVDAESDQAEPKQAYKPVRDDIDEVPAEAPLMSRATDDLINSAFADLSHTVIAANSRTLDDLVRDMLRPMIKAWLDDNLPTMVERLVRQEIERVRRGR